MLDNTSVIFPKFVRNQIDLGPVHVKVNKKISEQGKQEMGY